MIFDAHVHVGPWLLAGLDGLAATLDEAVRAALRESITAMAVTISDGGDNAELRRLLSQEERIDLWFFPWIRPGSDEAVSLIGSEGPRVAGLKIHPSVDRTPISDTAYDEVFKAAEEADLPLLIHTGRWQEMAGFELALARAESHPDLKIVLAHAGGNEFGLRQRCIAAIEERGLERVWLDLTGLGMPLLTRRLVAKLGAHRFLFGSDYPLGHPRVQIAHITAMDLPADQTEAILWRNARGLLGAPSSRRSA